jgi:hypothetical protein
MTMSALMKGRGFGNPFAALASQPSYEGVAE